MIKNLEQLLYAPLRTALFATVLALPLSCNNLIDANYRPDASLSVTPKIGYAPLKVRINLTGTDGNGVDDIKHYSLHINNKVIYSSNPIDTTITFTTAGIATIYGEIVDSEHMLSRTRDVIVDVKSASPAGF